MYSTSYVFSFQPIDKQSLLDSGILGCLIHTLNALLTHSLASEGENPVNYEQKVKMADVVLFKLDT